MSKNDQQGQCEDINKADLEKSGNTQGCEECEKTGSEWVHLRLCLACGHVGCCDASKNKHGTKHFKDTMHPVIKSFEPGESWKWCFVDEIFVE
jgi:uncharacterized UBP type Zn finger protein